MMVITTTFQIPPSSAKLELYNIRPYYDYTDWTIRLYDYTPLWFPDSRPKTPHQNNKTSPIPPIPHQYPINQATWFWNLAFIRPKSTCSKKENPYLKLRGGWLMFNKGCQTSRNKAIIGELGLLGLLQSIATIRGSLFPVALLETKPG